MRGTLAAEDGHVKVSLALLVSEDFKRLCLIKTVSNVIYWRINVKGLVVAAMERKDIEEKVIKIIAEQLGRDVETISGDSDIANDLGADSLDAAELIMAFEEEFDTSIEDDKSQNFTRVSDVVDQLYQQLNA